jgi:sigma-B regulation protein RsbU (phosphoserine phosphatase)
MENRNRAYGWRTWGDPAREALIAVCIGILYSIIESAGRNVFPDAHTLTRNSIIVPITMLIARLLETMLSWAIEQSRYPTIFRVIIYAAGGWVGYAIALLIVAAVMGIDRADLDVHGYHFSYALAVTASLSVLIGFVIHHNRKRNDRLRDREFAAKELEIARAMQRRLLPPEQIEHEGFRVSSRTEPARIVGGDFYDVVPLNDGAFAIVVADVSGKGIAASLVMASCKAMIPFLASTGGAAEVMSALNARLCEQLERREFVAAMFARFDPRSGSLDVVNAGMPDPLILHTDGTMNPLAFTGDRLPLGAKRVVDYKSTNATLARGERLVAFSDGLPEATVDGSPIGYDRIETMVREMTSIDSLLAEVRRAKVDDDMTVVIVERT